MTDPFVSRNKSKIHSETLGNLDVGMDLPKQNCRYSNQSRNYASPSEIAGSEGQSFVFSLRYIRTLLYQHTQCVPTYS